MQRVIVINLNGVACQLDENAFEALSAYLRMAAVELEANPDKTEIIADIEQAIVERCSKFLGPYKTVIALRDIQQVIQEMGPVEGGGSTAGVVEAEAPAPSASEPGGGAGAPAAPRRLYRIRAGSMVSGVCNGLGAFLGIDPTIVRIAFVLFTVLTQGAWVMVYIVLAFVTPDSAAVAGSGAAHGDSSGVYDLVEQARAKYFNLKEKYWSSRWWQPRRERKP